METLLRDRIFFDESGGGVTLSGGEPLMQAAFVIEALRLLQAQGVHTALDTCGFARWQDLRDAAAHADLVLYDLKLMDDDAAHGRPRASSNRVILDNLRALTAIHANIWIRIPVIPGVNDDEANLDATAAFLRPLARHHARRPAALSPDGRGEVRPRRHGLPAARHAAPSAARLETLAAHVRAAGLTTTIGGHA